MSKGVKIFLLVMLLICGGGVIIVSATILYLKSRTSDIKDWGIKLKGKASDFGKGRNPEVCLNEAMKRAQGCSSLNIKCSVEKRMFLNFCIKAANKSRSFCRGVPATTSIMDTAQWRVNRCLKFPKVDRRVCSNILPAVQQYCHPK